jgi:hypothetical protein
MNHIFYYKPSKDGATWNNNNNKKKTGCKKYIINPIIYDRLSNGYKDKRLPGNTNIR